LILGGDFNARKGVKGGPIGKGKEEEEEMRRSKDKVVNKEEKILLEVLRERGWIILNGSFEKEGEWTFVGETGMSVIDYVVSNVKASEEILKVEEGYRTESDHIPLEVTIEVAEKEQEERNDTIEKEKHV